MGSADQAAGLTSRIHRSSERRERGWQDREHALRVARLEGRVRTVRLPGAFRGPPGGNEDSK